MTKSILQWSLLLLAAASAQETNSSAICSTALSTFVEPGQEEVSHHGVVFAIETSQTDTVGKSVISMGFHVDPALMVSSSFKYEIYALNVDGYYAHPDRSGGVTAPLEFDYRGKLSEWTLVSNGEIFPSDLQVSITTPLSTQEEYYEIPIGQFTETPVPPNGGQKSFYITLYSAGLILATPENIEVNQESPLASGERDGNSPKILIGEGTSAYPFGDKTYLYRTKMFMGKVLFEKKCPTESPSISIVPSPAPSNIASESPSDLPSYQPSSIPSALPSSMPSTYPSHMPSEIPSALPSTIPTITYEEVKSGLMLTLDIGECKYNAAGRPIQMSKEEQDAVAETVKQNAAKESEGTGVFVTDVSVDGLAIDCGRRLLGEVASFASVHHRQLPAGAAAVEFSMVITGEYRPQVIPGKEPEPMPRSLDLGELVEDSINRDPDQFVRDLKERAPPTSSLMEVETLAVESVELPPEGEKMVWTKKPTPAPTNPPFENVTRSSSFTDSEKTILLACIVATAGIIIILSLFLAFRYISRQAVRRHERETNRRERKRRQLRARHNEFRADAEWAYDMDTKHNTSFGSSQQPRQQKMSVSRPQLA